ncbi:MAG: hypothetical protein KGY99_02620 [Phycisphaerae bacterium]|nr:hypothetical protein [Phycisphaerae bacterium]
MLASVFHHPMDLSTVVALWLVLPLVVAVAVCYKTLRTRNVRRLPLEAAALVGYIVAGLVALGAGLYLIQEYWP